MGFHLVLLRVLCLALAFSSELARAENCIEMVIPVQQLNSDRYVVSPDSDAAMFIVGDGDSFSITSFKTGKVTKLTGIVGSPTWMADGRLMTGQAAGSTAKISELLRGGKTVQVLNPAKGELVDRPELIQLGRHFFKMEKDPKTDGVRLTTEPGSERGGASVSMEIPKEDLDRNINVRVKAAQYYFENRQAGTIELRGQNNLHRSIRIPKSADIVASSDESGRVVMASKYVNGRIKDLYVVDLNQGTVRSVPMPKASEQELADFKHDIRSVPSTEGLSRRQLLDRPAVVKPKLRENILTMNLEGTLLAIKSDKPDENPLMVDLQTGKTSVLGLANASFNSGGALCGVSEISKTDFNRVDRNSEKKAMRNRCVDPKNGRTISDSVFSFPAESYLTQFSVDRAKLSGLAGMQLVCYPQQTFVRCSCGNCKQVVDGRLREAVDRVLCDKTFDPKDWSALDPLKAEINEDEASSWLRRFAKPGGFEQGKHLGILMGILSSGLQLSPAKAPLVSGAMATIRAESSGLYDGIIRKHPELIVESKSVVPAKCATKKELAALDNKLAFTLAGEFAMTPYSDYDGVGTILSYANKHLGAEARDTLAEELGDRLLAAATNDGSRLFASKLFKVLKGRLATDLGLRDTPVVELDVARDIDAPSVRAEILSSEPGEGFTRRREGFYSKPVELSATHLKPGEEKTAKLNWKIGMKDFSADVKMSSPTPPKELFLPAKSPDYASWKKDGVVRGTVVVSPNLHGLEEGTKYNYLSYYRDHEKFVFGEPRKIKDAPKFLKERISGASQSDYLIKEAHADGDDQNVMEIAKDAVVYAGSRITNGIREEIELIMPSLGKVSIGQKEFGGWVRDREKSSGGELLYLNSSCWSMKLVASELWAARSTKLINIGSTTESNGFSPAGDSVMRAVVDGVRHEANFEQIRKVAKRNRKYASGQGNAYLFPDEIGYKEFVDKTLPLEVEYKVIEAGRK